MTLDASKLAEKPNDKNLRLALSKRVSALRLQLEEDAEDAKLEENDVEQDADADDSKLEENDVRVSKASKVLSDIDAVSEAVRGIK